MPRSKKKLSLRDHLETPNPFLRALYIAGGIILVFFAVSILWVALYPIPDLNPFDSRKVAQSTKIYDRTGKTVLYDLDHNMRRYIVPLEEISPNLQEATLAIEDSNFYNHNGISIRAITRAIIVDIQTMSFAQGGSTITQQVVKNTILTGKKSPIRKIQEWILALKLEQRYSKEEILEFYFNVTPWGGTLYGAEAATRAFYGKSATDLTVAEAAYLAAIPQLPTYYSPYGNNRADLDARKNLVLDRMLKLGYITEEEYATAKSEVVTFSHQQNNSIIAPHFVFFIEQELEKTYGPDVVSEGLTVITTLDAELQHEAEAIVNRYAIANEARFDAENAALVAIDPKTGQILTMVGSRDYFDENIQGSYNSAIANRQPGSSFKPFVYATALAKGYTPESVVYDLPTQFSTACSPADTFNNEYPCYAPRNYDGNFRGPMTFTTALAQSINIPAIEALYLAGIDSVIDQARKMGITTLGNAKDYGLSFALGAAEVRLLDMASAFGVFGNDGIRHPATGILEVRDKKGMVLEKFEEHPELALDPQVARQISSMLSNNDARIPAYAPNNPLTFPGYDVAAKTGTTNESRDAWTVGYTPTVAVAAWAGNNDNSPMVKEIAGYIVAPMWHEVMQMALEKYPKELFNEPAPTPDDVTPALRGVSNVNGSFHSLLHWTDKDNPRGGPPAFPGRDPQYPYWEHPIQLWLANGGIAGGMGTSTASSTDQNANDNENNEDEENDRRRNRDNDEDN